MPPADPFPLRTTAPAKVNWTLEVLGRREDGYHEIRSVMQTISLVDDLEARPAPGLTLTVEGSSADDLGDDDNLVLRAAQLAAAHAQVRPLSFHLVKRIPAAAGLGGGSSDAAAALRLLDALAGLGSDLPGLAVALGSDVPFFLAGGTQLASGRGERLQPLPSPPPIALVLLTPPLTVPNKTARLYAEIDPAQYTSGAATTALAARIRAGRAPDAGDYVNVFDGVADRVFIGLPDYRRALEQATGSRAMLAGAGPSLFAVCDAAEASADTLRRQRLMAWAVATAE